MHASAVKRTQAWRSELRMLETLTLSLLLSLTPSMRSVNTAWLRLLCSFSCVQPTVRFSMARANKSSTSCTSTAHHSKSHMQYKNMQQMRAASCLLCEATCCCQHAVCYREC